MKLLFVGPYPPPHGGVSVHLAGARRAFHKAGIRCEVLNVEPRAAADPKYIKISNGFDFALQLIRHAWNDWTLHVHTNGHNPKSWGIALACGVAAAGGVLTLHSGMLPAYLRNGNGSRRTLARLACLQYERIVCVSPEIGAAISDLGIPAHRIDIMAAFLPPEVSRVVLPDSLEEWLAAHHPIVSTAVFFRPEYGVELLIHAIGLLKKRFPHCGCLVMGSGENRMAIELLIEQEGLSGTVRLQGDVDHEMCLALMRRSAVFVRPTFEDGDSISVREAAALDVPVVASAVGTRPEGVRLFPPGDLDALVSQISNALDYGVSGSGAGGREDPVRRLFDVMESVSHCPI